MNQNTPPPNIPRRKFITTVATGTAVVSGIDSVAQFAPFPGPAALPADAKEVSLLPDYQNHVKFQKTLVWCWAATLESIFSWHKIADLSQESIVSQVWGRPMQMTSGDTFMLMGEVNRNYRRTNKSIAGLHSRILSLDLGFSEINNSDFVEAIRARKPCILCTMTHMMVLVAIAYRGEGRNTQILGAKLMDPMQGIRFAHPLELTLPNVAMGGRLRFMAIPEIIKA